MQIQTIQNASTSHFERKVRKRAIEGMLALSFQDIFKGYVPVVTTTGPAASWHERNWGIVTGKQRAIHIVEWDEAIIPLIKADLPNPHKHTRIHQGCVFQTVSRMLTNKYKNWNRVLIDADLTVTLRYWEKRHWEDFSKMVDNLTKHGVEFGFTLTSSLRCSGWSKAGLGASNMRIIRKIERKFRRNYTMERVLRRTYRDGCPMMTQAWHLVPKGH